MKIGIDASCWVNRRGFGRFTREIVQALLELDTPDEYWGIIDEQAAARASLPPRLQPIPVATRVSPSVAASADGHRSAADLLRMSRAAARSRFDLFFFPAVYSYFPLPPGRKTIVTFHDTIAEKHPERIFPTRRSRLFWHLKSWLALRQADLVLTVSRSSRDAVLAQWRLDPARVRFIHEAAGSLFRPTGGDPAGAEALAALGLAPDTRYLLYVGGISPHKNLSLLIDAFCALTAEAAFAGTKLLLVGDIEKDVFHSSLSEHREALRAKERGSDVVFTGFVPDAALVHLYNRSTALVLPSLDEGFGLPAIEAMACGTPVVASRAGSLPEVVGDAGLLFDPRDGEDLVARLRVVLGDPAVRAALSRQCLERAAGFSWAHAAGELRGIFEELHGR